MSDVMVSHVFMSIATLGPEYETYSRIMQYAKFHRVYFDYNLDIAVRTENATKI